VTALVATQKLNIKNFPFTLYQIGTKFRDEARPRHGLLRCREFIMKDAYSFDKTQELAYKTYESIYDAYTKIFSRFELTFVAVEADSGNIGGSKSHEFQVLSEIGEDTLMVCECGKYSSNIEKSKSQSSDLSNAIVTFEILKVKNELNEEKIFKVQFDSRRELNLFRIKSEFNLNSVEIFKSEENLKIDEFLVDESVSKDKNKSNNVKRGYFTLSMEGDFCCSNQNCLEDKKKIIKKKGIEVGHVFYLGKKYSKVLEANFLNEKNEIENIEMGCYGIGVSRTLQAIVENSNDSEGIIWPCKLFYYLILKFLWLLSKFL
jgi:prolyl-tRNA synthetase